MEDLPKNFGGASFEAQVKYLMQLRKIDRVAIDTLQLQLDTQDKIRERINDEWNTYTANIIEIWDKRCAEFERENRALRIELADAKRRWWRW